MYKITIEKINTVTKKAGHNWEKIGESNQPFDTGGIANHSVERENGVYAVYGYTPVYETTGTETIEILKQAVDEIDLPQVIKAINDL